MKQKKINRSAFIALLSLVLCLGIPQAMRAADTGGCDGRNMIQRKKVEDVVGAISFLAHKLNKHSKNSCVASEESPGKPTVKKFVMPVPVVKNTPAVVLPEAPDVVSAHPVYIVDVPFSREFAQDNGIVPGTYPAMLMQGEDKNGSWGKQKKMTVAVKTDMDGKMFFHVVTKRPPVKNASVAIDFENGNALEIENRDLLKGAMSHAIAPKPAKKKRYKSLKVAYPLRTPVMEKIARFAFPTVLHASIGFATMGPVGAAMAPVSLVGQLATSKIISNQRQSGSLKDPPPLHVAYLVEGQRDDIDALKVQIAELQRQMKILEQNSNQKISGSKQ